MLVASGSPAQAQSQPYPDTDAGVSTTPPVPLTPANPTSDPPRAAPTQLPNTGSDPRLLTLAGLALTLLGFGLRLRTADADEY